MYRFCSVMVELLIRTTSAALPPSSPSPSARARPFKFSTKTPPSPPTDINDRPSQESAMCPHAPTCKPCSSNTLSSNGYGKTITVPCDVLAIKVVLAPSSPAWIKEQIRVPCGSIKSAWDSRIAKPEELSYSTLRNGLKNVLLFSTAAQINDPEGENEQQEYSVFREIFSPTRCQVTVDHRYAHPSTPQVAIWESCASKATPVTGAECWRMV
mmetsp:Transcript_60073/g.161031  ORF Transcript_60073/g.161031 Transcript_60073/m.161031 type:complete len:212 (+) Transcript_60073:1814-2449(+)